MYTHILALLLLAGTATAQQHLGVSTDALTFRKTPKTKTSVSGVTTGSLAFEKDLAKQIITQARQSCARKKPKNATPFNIQPYRKCVIGKVNLTRTRLKELTRTRDIF